MSRVETFKKKQPIVSIILAVVFTLILISTSITFYLYPWPSNEQVAYTDKQNPILFQQTLLDNEASIIDDVLYLPFEFVKQYIDESISYDESSQSIIITTSQKVIQMPTNQLEYFINDEPLSLEFPVLLDDTNNLLIPIKTIEMLYPFKISLLDSGIVYIQQEGDIILPAFVKSEQREHDLKLRQQPDIAAPYVATIMSDEMVYIEGEDQAYYLVRKEDGVAGYVQKQVVTLQKPIELDLAFEQEPKFNPPISWPINLTWEPVYSRTPDPSTLPLLPGVNVVSPTWFELKNGEGDVSNLATKEYMEWAKNRGYHVWALFSNDFSPEKTHEAFSTFETREKIIKQLLAYSEMYGVDGINIDIENVNLEDGPLVTQFVKEAAPYFHQAGLIVSMDVTFISESARWSKFYEREKLAEVVDYMMVMAYDEHWGSSPKAGSVASLPWVERNLQRLLDVVPAEQVVLGIPLYTRLWIEQETDEGNIEVSSKALTMDTVDKWIADRQLEPIFDEASGQNFVEYRDEANKTTYKIWLEDSVSLTKRVQLMHKYGLAGVATWARTFANENAWLSIEESIKHIKPANELE
ncbi:peptidoglycan hydrolase [Bacillus sp. HMF5848]|uniref:glycosyl hydrolase family 18 protein n=1 Tax=Bacillus sp. HMF5848 TaxID=2495421 RepID=UPI000F776423|nr:glycosyl hydrolase family 18 protein [Bacillus sp. HMF5848]RSK27151.1 peptidoglycan hydrolase [Bacillus sp. HMF5848]